MKIVFDLIWDKVPWWAKWPIVIAGLPTALVLSYLSWHSNDIKANTDQRFGIIEQEQRHYKEAAKMRDDYSREQFRAINRKLDILIDVIERR